MNPYRSRPFLLAFLVVAALASLSVGEEPPAADTAPPAPSPTGDSATSPMMTDSVTDARPLPAAQPLSPAPDASTGEQTLAPPARRAPPLAPVLLAVETDTSRFRLPPLSGDGDDTIPGMALDSAVALVVRGNHDIQLARARWLASREAAWSAWGLFEPRLTGRYNRQETNLSGPLTEVKEDYKLGVQGVLPTATQYDVGMRHSNYFYSSTTSEMFAGVSLRQPILKGAWFFAPFAAIRLARAEERKAYHDYRSEIAATIAKLHSSFWECVYASQLLNSETESVRIARDLLRDGVQRIATGKISPLDLEKISSELAGRISRSLEARRQLQDARKQLTLALSSPETPWLGSVRPLLPADLHLSSLGASESPLADSLSVWNPEYLSQESEIARMEISVSQKRDERLPTVDLIGSYGYVGTGRNGTIAREDFENTPHPQISAGVEVEFPLAGDIKQTYLVRAELLGLRSARTRLSQIALKCRKDQADLVQQIEQFLQQSREERRMVVYHQREFEAELRKLAAGKSNYQQIYDIEEKQRDAQKRMLEAIRSFQLARVELARARGTLLRDNGLERIDEDGPRLARRFLSNNS